jgi:Raf kinase inhibitor-like YbhB/YbcL family protein
MRNIYMGKLLICLLLAIIFLFNGTEAQEGASDMKITSPDFVNNGKIPVKFTCQGEDVNPALMIDALPGGTKSLALIVDDPDAPSGEWVHWVLYDVPPRESIEENSSPGRQGPNDSGELRYNGPCPPSGAHRYFFKLFALDKVIGVDNLDKKSLEREMKGHILAQAVLVGIYQRK